MLANVHRKAERKERLRLYTITYLLTANMLTQKYALKVRKCFSEYLRMGGLNMA